MQLRDQLVDDRVSVRSAQARLLRARNRVPARNCSGLSRAGSSRRPSPERRNWRRSASRSSAAVEPAAAAWAPCETSTSARTHGTPDGASGRPGLRAGTPAASVGRS
jgi:hypothetical protein